MKSYHLIIAAIILAVGWNAQWLYGGFKDWQAERDEITRQENRVVELAALLEACENRPKNPDGNSPLDKARYEYDTRQCFSHSTELNSLKRAAERRDAD